MTVAAWLAAWWLGVYGPESRADTYEQPACQLAQDPATPAGREALGLNLCLSGQAGGEVGGPIGERTATALLDWGQAYGGLFVTPYLSFQGRGFWRHVVPRGHDSPSEKTLDTDFAVVQVGNPVLNTVRLTAGLSRLPFGIDTSGAPQLYQRLENPQFWASPEQAVYLTFDDLKAVKVEIGGASNDWRRRLIADDLELGRERLDRAASLRVSYDMSALEGTRIVASVYGAKNGERRFGAGLVNRNRKGDYTEFEWVRRQSTPDGEGSPFQQLLRFGYIMHWQGQGRWVAQFDDERSRFRRGILDYDLRFLTYLRLRVGLGYQKDESGGQDSHWIGMLGTEADL